MSSLSMVLMTNLNPFHDAICGRKSAVFLKSMALCLQKWILNRISSWFFSLSAGVCGCCGALRPRYKRLVDNIFPEDPEVIAFPLSQLHPSQRVYLQSNSPRSPLKPLICNCIYVLGGCLLFETTLNKVLLACNYRSRCPRTQATRSLCWDNVQHHFV